MDQSQSQYIIDLMLALTEICNSIYEKVISLDSPSTKEKILVGDEYLSKDDLLDNQDVCEMLRISKRTLQRYRQLGKIPFYKFNGKTIYKRKDISSRLRKYSRIKDI